MESKAIKFDVENDVLIVPTSKTKYQQLLCNSSKLVFLELLSKKLIWCMCSMFKPPIVFFNAKSNYMTRRSTDSWTNNHKSLFFSYFDLSNAILRIMRSASVGFIWCFSLFSFDSFFCVVILNSHVHASYIFMTFTIT